MTRLKIVALIFLAVLLAGLPAYGQMFQAPVTHNRAAVPFPFVVTDIDNMTQNLPAGEYSVTFLSPTALLLKGQGFAVHVAIQEKLAADDLKQSKLVFMKTGEKYVLHQIWTEGHTHIHDLVHSESIPEVK